MSDVAGSPNDPIFLNHHTMIDCLFEQWLQRGSDPSPYPSNLGPMFAGHGGGDCVVPFFPLYNHSYFYRPSRKLGYQCDLQSFTTSALPTMRPPPPPSGAMATGAVVALPIAVLVMAIFGLMI